MGERDDNIVFGAFPTFEEVVSLSSFIDANFSVQYKINEQLHAFVEANNIFGGSYERWLNYPVQDLQVLGGVSFQFDW
jgi:outer membrane cobalamin receptor